METDWESGGVRGAASVRLRAVREADLAVNVVVMTVLKMSLEGWCLFGALEWVGDFL